MVVLVCLLPLALYCLYLAWLNGSKRAWLIHGHWDFAWVLFALSGFLLVGGPAILTGFSEYWRTFWLGAFAGRPWSTVLAADRTISYLLIGSGYLLLVVGIAARTLWRRRLTTVIYNVDVAAFEAILVQAMEGLGLRWVRSGNFIGWHPAGQPSESDTEWESAAGPSANPAAPRRDGAKALASLADPKWPRTADAISQSLQLETSSALRYVCLHWRTADGWPRQALEEELHRYREQLRAHDNPLGFWLLLVATVLVLGVFLAMAGLLVLMLLGRW